MVRGLRVERREGLLLALKRAGGPTAFGEIAPLPGLHDETLEDARRSLSGVVPMLPGLLACSPQERRLKLDAALLPPSVATGVEMALLNFDASLAGSLPPLPAAFPPARRLGVNALLAGDPGTVMARAATCHAAGFRTFKLKVQAGRIEEAIACIRAFHDAFGDTSELRLDANQSMELEEAIEFGRSIPPGSISYIEEPVRDASRIPEFHAATSFRSALDETLWQRPGMLEALPPESLGALVLKPNRLGGIMRSLDLAALALRMGLATVFSSAFESGLSLGMYALMAAISSPQPQACGLDTISFLDHDLLETPFATPCGEVDPLAAWHNGTAVRQDLLIREASWTW